MSKQQPVRIGDKFQCSDGVVLEVMDRGYGDLRNCRMWQGEKVFAVSQYRVRELQAKPRVIA